MCKKAWEVETVPRVTIDTHRGTLGVALLFVGHLSSSTYFCDLMSTHSGEVLASCLLFSSLQEHSHDRLSTNIPTVSSQKLSVTCIGQVETENTCKCPLIKGHGIKQTPRLQLAMHVLQCCRLNGSFAHSLKHVRR